MGRQLTSRETKSGEEMSVRSAVTLVVTLFAAGIGVVVLLVYSLSAPRPRFSRNTLHDGDEGPLIG